MFTDAEQFSQQHSSGDFVCLLPIQPNIVEVIATMIRLKLSSFDEKNIVNE